MHEILISEEEVHHCIRESSYFAIIPCCRSLDRSAARKKVLFLGIQLSGQLARF